MIVATLFAILAIIFFVLAGFGVQARIGERPLALHEFGCACFTVALFFGAHVIAAH